MLEEKYYCDVCGKEVISYESTSRKSPYIVSIASQDDQIHEVWTLRDKMELCGECTMKLASYLNRACKKNKFKFLERDYGLLNEKL
jgi:hypothetical protein